MPAKGQTEKPASPKKDTKTSSTASKSEAIPHPSPKFDATQAAENAAKTSGANSTKASSPAKNTRAKKSAAPKPGARKSSAAKAPAKPKKSAAPKAKTSLPPTAKKPAKTAVSVKKPSTAQASPKAAQSVTKSASISPLPSQDERTWAMLAHLSILLNLVSGLLGIIAAMLIYLVYKDRSRYVAYQALQSLIFQSIAFIGGGLVISLAWIITALLMFLIVGFFCLPITLLISLIPLAAIAYGIIAAVEANDGKDFKYWLIGDWVRSTYEN